MNMREAFEKWYGENYSTHALKSWHVNHYANFDTELAWQSYQAAIAAVKEGGPRCYMGTYDEHDIRDMRTVVMRHKESFEPTPDRVVPLYILPEDK